MAGHRAVFGALLLTLPAFASDAIGVLHPTCGFPYQYILEITDYRGHRLEKAIQFEVLGDYGLRLYMNEWVESRRPTDAMSSRIQIVHVSRHWWRPMKISGNFEIIFRDGRKLEGPFKAKYVKPPSLLICE